MYTGTTKLYVLFVGILIAGCFSYFNDTEALTLKLCIPSDTTLVCERSRTSFIRTTESCRRFFCSTRSGEPCVIMYFDSLQPDSIVRVMVPRAVSTLSVLSTQASIVQLNDINHLQNVFISTCMRLLMAFSQYAKPWVRIDHTSEIFLNAHDCAHVRIDDIRAHTLYMSACQRARIQCKDIEACGMNISLVDSAHVKGTGSTKAHVLYGDMSDTAQFTQGYVECDRFVLDARDRALCSIPLVSVSPGGFVTTQRGSPLIDINVRIRSKRHERTSHS